MAENHANYQGRLDFIQKLLQQKFDIEGAEIVPIQYDPECPFKYNNFVYRVNLPLPLSTTRRDESQQPGTVAVPEGVKEFVLRLTNRNAEGMNPHTRVENEVAIISLAAAALSDFEPHVVPSVYGWGSAALPTSQGWILQELMPGVPADESFGSMHFEEKKRILAQMAKFLKALQAFQLPQSIEEYGGVTFDDTGRMVSAAMPNVGSGPWPSYESHFQDRLKRALKEADDNPYINGWHANGVRKRLEAFIESGIPAQFSSFESKHEKSIVHADFTPNNLLHDASTQCITVLLDYDFASISHPSYEFFRSFSGIEGQFQGQSDCESNEQGALRDAKLHGFPSPLPGVTEDGVDWEVAKAWEDELVKLDVIRPRTIEGIEKIAVVDEVLSSILPWRVTNSDILRLQTEEVILKCRNENEVQLMKLLDQLGF